MNHRAGVMSASRGRGVRLCLCLATLSLAGCAGDLTTREKGTLGGAALGAGAGALIGSAVRHPGAGALIGAGLGAMTGAIVGDQAQAREQAKPAQPSPTSQSTPSTTVAQAPAPVQQASVPPLAADPTRGQLINGTPWRLDIYLDKDPSQVDSAMPITMKPKDNLPTNLDIGPHRIIARAYVETQFGTRLAGRFDRTVQIDPRSSGWSLQFREGDFR